MRHSELEVISSEIGSLKLDWYKNYNINVQSSCCKLDEYDDGSIIPHVSFEFLTDASWFNEVKAIKIAIMIEQLRLITQLEGDVLFKTFFFPITKENKISRISEELLDDWVYETSRVTVILETALEALDEAKKIVYQKRREWRYKIYKDLPADYEHGETVWIGGRSEFAILPKDAKRIINI